MVKPGLGDVGHAELITNSLRNSPQKHGKHREICSPCLYGENSDSRKRLFERGEGDHGEHVGNRLDDEPRGYRRAVVMQDRNESSRVEITFADEQSTQLRVAV